MQLSADIIKEIDKVVAKFPAEHKQSAVISALMIVQKKTKGWLSTEQMDLVADYLGVSRISVYEVASFYSMLNLKPVGRHTISLCTNISCMLRGSEDIAEHLCKKLNIDFNQTTADGKVTLRAVECLAACGGAPMMQVDDTYHENLTAEKVDQILVKLE
ncbi:MAG TPA: NADH-quinone oxidoreductase subunit NuoE [Gammaproteobacteria bacterium]|nr:NADH-quinone oxidoreductase subunit NuoE [Gammaproteobacteria bacterium]